MKKIISLISSVTILGSSTMVGSTGFISKNNNTSTRSVVDETQSNYVFQVLQSQDGTIYEATSAGLYMSKNGFDFTLVTGISSDLSISHIFQAKNGFIYLTSTKGFYFSKDNGVSFNLLQDLKFTDFSQSNFFQDHNGTIYIGVQHVGLFTSQNGVDFKQNTSVIVDKIYGIIDQITESRSGMVYVGTSQNGLFVDNLNKTNQFEKVIGPGDATQIIQMHNSDNVYVSSLKGLWVSSDGINFKQNTGAGTNISFWNILGTENDSLYLASNLHGVLYSTNEINFKRPIGIPTSAIMPPFTPMLQTANHNIYIAGGGVLYASQNGINFKNIWAFSSSIQILSMLQNRSEIVYAGTTAGLYSSNNGIDFHKV